MASDKESVHELRLALVQIGAFVAELFYALNHEIEDQEKKDELNRRFADALNPGLGRVVRDCLRTGDEEQIAEITRLLQEYGMGELVEQYRPRTS
jgi:hypothetical protein